ncbi:substrate-binding domain-containing protein [Paenarthrobacter ureafaciens]|nr:substrate-binding domain-containing protein [Paenarthrobacter ureafaciens]MEC3853155.1 substrate-binding domain-containing protein [Paenarthrobacter ureafaciens]
MQAYKRLAADKRVDGLLMTGARMEDPRFRLLEELRLPAVLIGPTPPGVIFPHVENDPPGAGMDECVRHLFALGHHRIAYIGGPLSRVQPKIRADAFLETMASVNLQPVVTISTDYTTDAAVSATRQVMERADTQQLSSMDRT